MPFALLILGVVFLIASARGTHNELFALLKADFTGKNNFIFWFLAILAIGALGYFEKLKPFSSAFLALVVIALVIARGNPDPSKNPGGGFFKQFVDQIQAGTQTTQPVTNNPASSDSFKFPSLTLPNLGNFFN